ncbi:PKD domain-containing protein [Sulfidibacter corallicola]|uniref:PKD domain-containing protein n=1 Tax=Sulfidibacter corallicola TaxID=2818388 RepID=A0A8A4TM57_SULCO|nr:PKD domain-containing protein [Sulfidibacter corallicola]QTD50294.1 PKD domain-containing protein [Sulfidibacter corallicola]
MSDIPHDNDNRNTIDNRRKLVKSHFRSLGRTLLSFIVFSMIAFAGSPTEPERTDGTRLVRIGDMWVRVRGAAPQADAASKRASSKRADDIVISLWANGIVNYRFADDVNALQRDIFDEAAKAWDALDNLDVQRIPDEGPNPANYIEVRNSLDGNNSALGMIGGKQVLNLQTWEPAVILHELGHAIGMLHEQQRPNRDTYITVSEHNALPDKRGNFTRVDGFAQHGDYDFRSIMHYHGHAFSRNGLPTMEPKPAYTEFGEVMGRLDTLSDLDIAEVETRYQGLDTPVTVPDANLRAALLEKADYDENGVLTVSEAASLRGILEISNRDIADLTGITACTSLTGLGLSGNQLTALPDLSPLANLSYLNLNGNQFTAVPTIDASLPLAVLFIQYNPLASESCTQLDAFRARGLKVLKFNPLADQSELDCGNTAPQAAELQAPDELFAGVAAEFGLDASDGDNDQLFVHWDFGDDSGPFGGLSVRHTYAAAGTYTVRVRVADRFGGLAELSRDVTVQAALDQPYLVLGHALGRPDDLVSLPLFFGHMQGAVALQCDLVFDGALLSGERVAAETGLAPHEFHLGFPEPGRARLTVFDVADNDALQQGRLVHIPLRVAAGTQPGSLPVRLENVFIVDAQAAHIAVGDLIAGSVQVIRAVNQQPKIFDYNATLLTSYEPYQSEISAFDLDGDSFLYQLVELPQLGDVTLDPLTGAMTYTPHPGQSGADTFSYRVFDGLVHSRTAVYTIDLQRGNAPPVIDTLTVPEQSYVGVPLTFGAVFSDPEGDDLHLLWDFGNGSGSNDAAPTVTYAEPGTYTVWLEISDGHTKVRKETQIDILANGAPEFVDLVIPNQGRIHTDVTFSAQVSDPDGDPLTVTWELGSETVLEGETVTHRFTTAGTRNLVVTVRDDKGASAQRTGSINIVSVVPPTIRYVHVPPTGSVNRPVSFWVGATDYNRNIDQFHWTFGDGTGATGYRVSHTYTEKGTYPVTLRVVDRNRLESRYDGSIVIDDNAAPVIHFVNGPDSLKTGTAGGFSVVAEDQDGDALTTTWSMGDGTQLTGSAVSHAFAAAGDYVLTVTVRDGSGAETQATKPVQVGDNGAPELRDIQLAAVRSRNYAFDFSATAVDAEGDEISYHWDFGNGETADTAAGSTRAIEVGIFEAVLTLTDSRGAVTRHAQLLEIVENTAPSLAWYGVPGHAKADLETHFIAQARDQEDDAVTYRWSHGEMTRDQAATPFTFTAEGYQTVILRLEDARGAWYERSFSVLVGDQAAPAVRALTMPSHAVIGQATRFAVEGYDPDGGDLTLNWRFNNVDTSDQAQFDHTFDSFSTVTVNLQLSDDQGNTTQITAYGLSVHFAPDIYRFEVPEQVKVGEVFDAQSTADDPENHQLEYVWDFGDGSPLVHRQSTTHSYDRAGQFLVTLTVTDQLGASAYRVQQVEAFDNLPPQIVELNVPAEGRVDVALQVSATAEDAEGEAIRYLWDFGDGSAQVEGNPNSHVYTAPGTYEVTLTAVDARNAASMRTATVEVFEYPVIADLDTPIIVIRDVAADFVVDAYNPSGGELTYSWDFGDGSPVQSGTGLDRVTHTYTELGLRRRLELTVSNGVRSTTAAAYVAVLGPDAEPVAFASEGFKEALVALFDTNGDGEISYGEAAAVDTAITLNSIGGNDISLQGLEAFVNAPSFDASNGRIVSVPHLSHLERMTRLELDSNDVHTMSTLPVNLTHLNLARNELRRLPSLPQTLTWLDCSYNQLLSGFGHGRAPVSLTYLNCSENSSDTNGTVFRLEFTANTNLETLIAKKNRIEDRYFAMPEGLESLTITHTGTLKKVPALPDSIVNLDLGYCPEITTIERLPANLEVFKFGGHNVHFSEYHLASIGDVSHVTRLPELDLANMKLAEVTGLNGMVALEVLDLGGNDLTAVGDLDALVALKRLDLGGNALAAVGALPANLETLDLGDNQLAEHPPLAHLTALTSLHLSKNQLTEVDSLATLTVLTSVDLSHNQLTRLPTLAQPNALTNLVVGFNPLGSLADLGDLPELTTLDCQSAELTALPDLGDLPKLATLIARHNELTSVPDIAANPDLQNLYLEGNLMGLDDCADIAAARGRVTQFQVNPLKDGSDLECPNTAPRIVSLNVPATGSYGANVTMSATVEDDENDRVTLHWDFGNGRQTQAYADESVTVDYPETGSYTVSVRAVDPDGLEDTAESVIVIGSRAPYVTRYGIPSQVFANTNTPFSIEAEDPEGDPITFTWDFGDGSATVTGAAVNHSFSATGTYTVTVTLDDGQGGISTFSRDVEVLAQNRYPDITRAEIPGAATVGVAVDFHVEASDPDGDTITYAWEFGDGATAGTASASHAYSQPGDYTVRIVVRDQWGYGRSTSGVVRVSAANRQPSIDAVEVPTTGFVGENLAMTATVSDPDGDSLTVTWRLGDGTERTGTSIQHSYATEGSYAITITVTDGRGGSATAVRNVNVSEPDNHQPEITALTVPSSANTGEEVAFSVTAQDPDGDALSYAWNFGDGSATQAQANVTHTFANAGDYTVNVTVSDGKGAQVTAGGVIHIQSETPVTELSVPITVTGLSAGSDEALYFRLQAAQNLERLTFTLSGGTGNADLYLLEGELPAVDNYDLVSIGGANDESIDVPAPAGRTWYLMVHGAEAFADASLTVGGDVENRPPVIGTASIPSSGQVGQTLNFDVDVEDPDGDNLVVTWTFGDGEQATGFAVEHAYTSAGTYDVGVTVSDGRGGEASAQGQVVIQATQGNQPPQVTGIDFPGSAENGESVTFTVHATDPNGDPLSYQWTFGDGSGASGQTVSHSYASGGVYSVEVRVSDGRGGTGIGTFQIQITEVPLLSIGDTVGDLSGNAGAYLLHKIVAGDGVTALAVSTSGGTGDMAIFVRAGQRPQGSDYDFVSWQAGNDERVDITDPAGKTWYVVVYGAAAFSDVTLTVSGEEAEGGNRTPTIAGLSLPESGEVGESLTFSVQASDADGDALTITWDTGDGGSGAGAQLTHAFSQPGTYTVTATVSDGRGGSDSATGTVTIAGGGANGTPSITGGNVPTQAIAGTPATFRVTATDPDDDPLTVSWDFGDGASGSGAETSHSYAAAGSYDWVVTVDDGRGGRINSNGTVQVVAQSGSNNPPQITGMSFSPQTETGVATQFSATATDPEGDALTYTWVFGDGATAEGQTVDHTFTEGGTLAVEVRVSDGRGGTATGRSSIQVEQIPSIAPDQTVTGLNASQNGVINYKLVVPDGVGVLAVNLSGGSGDADLYVREGAKPNGSQFDYRSWNGGNGESIEISGAGGKTWYIQLHAYEAFTGVTLSVESP